MVCAPKEQPEGSLGEAALGAPSGQSCPPNSAPAGAGSFGAPAGAKRGGIALEPGVQSHLRLPSGYLFEVHCVVNLALMTLNPEP